MNFILKHITLIRIMSLIPFVIVGMFIPVTEYFVLSIVVFIFMFAVFQLFLTILENKYKAINQNIFKRNVIIRVIHFIIGFTISLILFGLTDMYNNPKIVLPFLLLIMLSGAYIDHLDKKNTRVSKEL